MYHENVYVNIAHIQCFELKNVYQCPWAKVVTIITRSSNIIWMVERFTNFLQQWHPKNHCQCVIDCYHFTHMMIQPPNQNLSKNSTNYNVNNKFLVKKILTQVQEIFWYRFVDIHKALNLGSMQEGSKMQTMCTSILNTYNVKPCNPNFNKVWIFYQHKKRETSVTLKDL